MKKTILLVVSILFALMFINSGLNKFFNYIPMPDPLPDDMAKLFGALGSIGWLLPLVGLVEIIAGILVIPHRTRALGAIMIFPISVGVVLTHVVNIPDNLPLALVIFAINVWFIIDNREKYMPMIS
jgi:uncharacterized membrane protein YphA (DoxX/SURF4 family)